MKRKEEKHSSLWIWAKWRKAPMRWSGKFISLQALCNSELHDDFEKVLNFYAIFRSAKHPEISSVKQNFKGLLFYYNSSKCCECSSTIGMDSATYTIFDLGDGELFQMQAIYGIQFCWFWSAFQKPRIFVKIDFGKHHGHVSSRRVLLKVMHLDCDKSSKYRFVWYWLGDFPRLANRTQLGKLNFPRTNIVFQNNTRLSLIVLRIAPRVHEWKKKKKRRRFRRRMELSSLWGKLIHRPHQYTPARSRILLTVLYRWM